MILDGQLNMVWFWIRLISNKDTYIEFNEVKFHSNRFRPEFFSLPVGVPYNFAALFHVTGTPYGTNNSTRIKIDSCTFINNDVTGIALFQRDVYVDVINTQFHSNNPDFILMLHILKIALSLPLSNLYSQHFQITLEAT